jgi:hypothetical protein
MANPAQEPPKPTLSWLQPHSRGNVNIWRELLHDIWQKARVMRIMILGAGVQGTLYGVHRTRQTGGRVATAAKTTRARPRAVIKSGRTSLICSRRTATRHRSACISRVNRPVIGSCTLTVRALRACSMPWRGGQCRRRRRSLHRA